MRARTRFMLDIALMIAIVAAYRPTWTGVSAHQWLSIAIIAPLLLHLVVNWEWAVRILRTFIERLMHTSRLNFVVDTALLVSTVSVMLSGFMVSPALVAPLGIHPANPLVWHAVHLWSANATITIFALHAALHWRWFVATAKRLAEKPAPARVPAPAARRSRVGLRAAQAAAERAAARRTASVLGVTAALAASIFVGVGVASPLLAAAVQPHAATAGSTDGAASAATSQTCPKTGCTASRCHAQYGKSAAAFYGTEHAAKPRAKAARVASSSMKRATSRVVVAKSASKTSGSTKAKSRPTVASAAKPKPRVTASKAVKRKTASRMMVCPATGCSASSCHGAHHQSASSYYH